MQEDLGSTVERALKLEKRAVASLVSLFEDRRASAIPRRAEALAQLERRQNGHRTAAIVGITGTPGSGKSTLLSRLVVRLLAERADLSIAVVAVDPSSAISGGALLGDRTRMQLDREELRLFFRSQASATELGGLSPTSFQVCGLLSRIFGCVLVETVGIGQSEADIRSLADHTFLVLQPLGGDEVQFLKAGIMEVPDAFVLNKCDVPAAERSYHQLRASIGLARPNDGVDLPIYRTSARTGLGIDALTGAILAVVDGERTQSFASREAFAFERWIKGEWGRTGTRFLEQLPGGAISLLRECGGLDAGQAEFSQRLRAHLQAIRTPA